MRADATVITACGATHVGKVRESNEDAFVVSEVRSGALGAPQQPITFHVAPEGILLMVCDGMGGAAAGEIAARLACERVVYVLADKGLTATPADRPAVLLAAVKSANEIIFSEAQHNRDERGMGTTCTTAWILEDRLIVAQVGDSRAYLCRGGVLRPLTRDQSLAMAMVDMGVLAPAEVTSFPHGNVILQAVGTQEKVEPVLSGFDIQSGDTILLCSDGLHGVVADDQIDQILTNPQGLFEQSQALIRAALEAGGPDNVTVVLARIESRR